MSKTLMVSEEAYDRLSKARRPQESFTDVVLRITPAPPLTTGADLLAYLEKAKEPIIPADQVAYLRGKKQQPTASPRKSRDRR